MLVISLKQWWIGWTHPKTKEKYPGVMGYARLVSEQLFVMEGEPDMTPLEVIAWIAECLGYRFSDGTAKRKGSDFTYEENQGLNVALAAMLACLRQDHALALGEAA